jgi:hypothetical protein
MAKAGQTGTGRILLRGSGAVPFLSPLTAPRSCEIIDPNGGDYRFILTEGTSTH